ncbi:MULTISPECIES: globin domain-containing protein [Kitasatospora]|uniref:nitric oxide dioxygenase n=1 Tax=Kitasatospora cathayae TaxID=3004092 RepID=A0ABY7QE53_9ACTN|nr:globin domain-containing protein [Kitasatospora sp. HUAS 3-15]WBP90519.1 globin domain-containing protein [Kitasatospora sp. HUAS 3-15]
MDNSSRNAIATAEYDRLIARHHAMRLRRQLLAPAAPSGAGPAPDLGYGGCEGYDGAGDQQLIRRDLDLVAPLPELIDQLYEVMFRRRPYLRPLFPASMEFQQAHLERVFQHLIDHLHQPADLDRMLRQLGRDHRKLGVRPIHYEAFEEALCAALRHRAGEHWTEDLEAAWVRMLRFAVGAMVAGADAALTEPPYWHAVVTGHERRRPDLAVLRVRTGEPYPYRAGQYGTVEHPALPHTWRQYSMGCAPRGDNELEFHVRRTGPDGVSAALVERTAVGDRLRLGPPRGSLLPDGDSRDLLLVAGGTGLAPMKAIIEQQALHRPPGRRVHLFVGARDRADLYDWQSLSQLVLHKTWLSLTPVTSGRLADAVIAAGDWREHQACLTGPTGMVASMHAELLSAGLPLARIRFDQLLSR